MSVIVGSISIMHLPSSFNLKGHGIHNLLLFTKQAPFVMHGIVGKVTNNNVCTDHVALKRTHNAVHYNVLCSLHLVGLLFIRLGTG